MSRLSVNLNAVAQLRNRLRGNDPCQSFAAFFVGMFKNMTACAYNVSRQGTKKRDYSILTGRVVIHDPFPPPEIESVRQIGKEAVRSLVAATSDYCGTWGVRFSIAECRGYNPFVTLASRPR